MISVLTATAGRRPAMLAEAVQSVRAQTFTDWEHIIVDDGSWSVGPVEGARVLAVSRRGPGPARNAGLEVARRDGYATIVRDFDAGALQRENFICLPATLVRTASLRAVGGFASGALEDRFHTDNLTYGGADPERTRRAKEMLTAAQEGLMSWDDYAARVAEVWA